MQMHGEPPKGSAPRSDSGRMLGILSLLNLAALVLAWGAENTVGERYWAATILTYAPQHPLIAPALLLAVWALMARRWGVAALNAVAAAFALFALLGAAWPMRRASAPVGTSIRVMTLNIHHASVGAPVIARVVREMKPDVLCIQESDQHPGTSDPARALQRLLPGWRMARAGELATFSRAPIHSHRLHPMPGGSDRAILETVISIRGRRLTVFNIHLDTASHPKSVLGSLMEDPGSAAASLRTTTDIRLAQAAVLLGLVADTRPPLLVAGDFNTPPRGLLYGRLAHALRDSFRAVGRGLGPTFRHDVPVLRIDYIWAGTGVTPLRCFVPRGRVSDHRPVVADLAL